MRITDTCPMRRKQGPDSYIATGDLLFTRLSGTLEYVGNCAVVGMLHGRKIEFPDRIFRGRCVSDISPNFIQLAFAEKTLRRSLEEKGKSSAGHQRISLTDLQEYCIPLPPLAEPASHCCRGRAAAISGAEGGSLG